MVTTMDDAVGLRMGSRVLYVGNDSSKGLLSNERPHKDREILHGAGFHSGELLAQPGLQGLPPARRGIEPRSGGTLLPLVFEGPPDGSYHRQVEVRRGVHEDEVLPTSLSHDAGQILI